MRLLLLLAYFGFAAVACPPGDCKDCAKKRIHSTGITVSGEDHAHHNHAEEQKRFQLKPEGRPTAANRRGKTPSQKDQSAPNGD